MQILVDSVLYNPSIEVIEVNKTDKVVTIIDLFNDNEVKHLTLHKSKKNGYHYYFRLGRQTFWLHNLYKNADRGDGRKSVGETIKYNELKEAILNNINTFANWEEYKQDYESIEEAKDDFNAEEEEGTIQNITLSTYNGASNKTTYHTLSDQTILDSILTDIHDLNLYNMLTDYKETVLDESEINTDLEYILTYTEFYNVFTLNKLLYVKKL